MADHSPSRFRWLQLAAGVLGMVAVANFQYGWTFFVPEIQREFGWDLKLIQWAFTLFVLTETWLVPVEAYVADRFGPRRVMVVGALLVTAAWALNSVADSLSLFYLAAVIGGTGAGMVYGTSMGSALKWFPDRRGFAAGLTAAGFGAGSALTVAPILWTIQIHGFRNAFLWFGIGQGLVVLIAGLVMRFPRPGEVPEPAPTAVRPTAAPELTPWQMVRTPVFWLMYLMMTVVTVGGLTLVAQVDLVSTDAGVRNHDLSLGFIVLPVIKLATMLERILGGVTRPIFGWVSDRVGREPTMFVAFALEGLSIYLLTIYAQDPTLFVVFTGLTFFFWGEIYSLFPATVGDTFGRRYATTNYALMYTAKGSAALVVQLLITYKVSLGGWVGLLTVSAVLAMVTAVLALLVLRPVRRHFLTESSRT